MINKDKPIVVKQRSIGATSMVVDKLKQDGYSVISHDDITKLKKYIFLDVATDKGAYRWTEIVAIDEINARTILHDGDEWLPLIGIKETRSKNKGRKSRLIYDRKILAKNLIEFNLTVEEADQKISFALMVASNKIAKFYENIVNNLDVEKAFYDTFYDKFFYDWYGFFPLKVLKTTETAIATESDLNLINNWNDYYFGRKLYGRKD